MRHFLIVLTCLSLSSQLLAAKSPLETLETVTLRKDSLQPGLERYRTLVETSKISETIDRKSASMTAEASRPAPPIIEKYWMRDVPRSLIVAEQSQTAPYIAQLINRFSKDLAIEFDNVLLPTNKASQRQKLANAANVKLTEVLIADTPLQRVEFIFDHPADLAEAFYTTGLRLPQKQIIKLAFDIDKNTLTINEMTIQTVDGLILTVEIRYLDVAGGFLPQRIQITSPDGHVDDLTEVTFKEISGFHLPSRMVHTFRSPSSHDDLIVTFTDYRINQLFPEDIRTQFEAIQQGR